VIIADHDALEPAMHTRFGRKVAISAPSGPKLVEDLLALGATIGGRPVLFLTSDEAVSTVSEHREVLIERFRFRLPPHHELRALMHKGGFQELALRHGFPVPRAVRIACAADSAALDTLTFPCIIKPTVKTAQYQNQRFARAYKVESRAEAEVMIRRILPAAADVLVQEWIDGDVEDIHFCLQYRSPIGTTLASFTGRKLSIWPPDVGVTASCVEAPEAHRVLDCLTAAFFASVNFVGIGSVEYKRDRASGKFLMIEPTVGRVDWQEEVATLHGVNIPLAAYLDQIGGSIPRSEPMSPIVWRDSWTHRKAARSEGGAARPPPGARIYDAYWRLDDPMPAVCRYLGGPVRSLRHRRGRLQVEAWSAVAG
jgi:predicted ATP-grasp superfamily ATP-dependent carboligase